ncbi:MAG: hypothetical protein WD929_01910 [Steroidobacteraceae bacterium]
MQKPNLKSAAPINSAQTAADDDRDVHWEDATAARIHAFLGAVRPLRGCVMLEPYYRGGHVIAELAAASRGSDPPAMSLTLDQVADVLRFLSNSEPWNPRTFEIEPRYKPSHVVGRMFVLEALEGAVRQHARL